VLGRGLFRLVFHAFNLVIRKESFKIVTIWAIASKSIFIKQSLDAATCAHLVGTSLGAYGPAHFAVPAPPQYHGRPSHPSGQKAHGPEPARAFLLIRNCYLLFVFH
jgi:hypothetical protein